MNDKKCMITITKRVAQLLNSGMILTFAVFKPLDPTRVSFVHRERTLLMKCLHACAKKRAIYIGSQAYIVIATIVDYLFS